MHINGARVFFALKLTINSNLGNFPYIEEVRQLLIFA